MLMQYHFFSLSCIYTIVKHNKYRVIKEHFKMSLMLDVFFLFSSDYKNPFLF